MLTRRRFLFGLVASLMVLAITSRPVLAEESVGTIKSVDAKNSKIVFTPKKGHKDVEVAIDSGTSVEKGKGKSVKKFSIDRLQAGGTVNLTYDKGVASKLVLKKGSFKKKGK
jgi:hypothetical protein